MSICRRRHDRAAHGRAWGEDAVVAGEIDPRARYESSEPGYEILRSEEDMGGAVAGWVLQCIDDLPGGIG